MSARNPKAFEQSQRHRAIIREVMLDIRRRSPLAPLTAKTVAPYLPPMPGLSRSTLYRHMATIIAAECNSSDISGKLSHPDTESSEASSLRQRDSLSQSKSGDDANP